MTSGGTLPKTGAGILTIGGVTINTPTIALIGVALIILGGLLLRLMAPAKVVPDDE